MAKDWACTCSPKFPETICVVCVGGLLHYSPKTVYKKAEAGELPSVPTSRRHRIFRREAIVYWLRSQETGQLA
jgi:hypothetical protein